MWSNAFKTRKGERSSEPEQVMEIRFYNLEQLIFLDVKNQRSAKYSQKTSVLLCQESRYTFTSQGQT